MTRFSVLMAVGLACAACSSRQGNPEDTVAAQNMTSCIAGGGGYLHARLRGALVADINWTNADMQCDGGPRPELGESQLHG